MNAITKSENCFSTKSFVIYDADFGFYKRGDVGLGVRWVKDWHDADKFSYSGAIEVIGDSRNERAISTEELQKPYPKKSEMPKVEPEFDKVIEIDFIDSHLASCLV